MTRVVSLAVFGESSHYCPDTAFFRRHLGAVIRGYRALFPGWEIRVHHDDSIYQGNYGAALFGLARRGIIKLVRVAAKGEPLCQAMLWRMLPVWDPGVEIVIARDADACPMYADRVAVERFIASGAAVHSISAVATHNTPLSGGLCGFRSAAFIAATGFESWPAMIGARPDMTWGTHGADECMLRLLVWPRVRHLACEHRLGGAPQFAGVLESHTTIDGDAPDLAPWLRDSRGLAEYMGISGFDADRACRFFFPAADESEITGAETFAGESFAGDVARMPWVALATDRSDFYSFFAPLTVRMWRRLGFRARLFLVGTSDEWQLRPHDRLVVSASREAGASIVFVPRVEEYANGTVAQLVRLFAAGYGFDDGEFVYTSDVDLWPLSAPFFCERDFSRLNLLAANEDGVHFSMTLGAPASMWRALMGVGRTDGPAALRRALQENVAAGGSMEQENWIADERLLARRLLASPLLAGAVHAVRHGDPPIDRLDRAHWRTPRSIDGLVDAHLPRPGWEHWASLRALLDMALTIEDIRFADRYFADWMAP